MATCDATPLQSILNTHLDVEYVLAKQPRLFWRGSDEPQAGRWVFSCSSFSKFSNSIFFQKAVVFLVHEKGESEREKGSNFLFLFVPQSRRSLKISWRSFFQVHHCILHQVCEWWAKCEDINSAGRGLGLGERSMPFGAFWCEESWQATGLRNDC